MPDDLLDPLARAALGEGDFDSNANLTLFSLSYKDALGEDTIHIGYARNIQNQGHL